MLLTLTSFLQHELGVAQVSKATRTPQEVEVPRPQARLALRPSDLCDLL